MPRSRDVDFEIALRRLGCRFAGGHLNECQRQREAGARALCARGGEAHDLAVLDYRFVMDD